MTKTVEATKIETAMANGTNARNAPQSAAAQKARSTKKAPAKKAPARKKGATGNAKKNVAKAKKAKANRLILRTDSGFRAKLTAAAKELGGSRLMPVDFPSYTAFLAGVPLDAKGNAETVLHPMKGKEQQPGKVTLVVKDGAPSIRTAKTA